LRKLGTEGARQEGAPLEELLKLDVEQDHAIVFDIDGHPLAAIPATIGWSSDREGSVTFLDEVETGPEPSARRRVHFETYGPSATAKRGPVLTFDVAVRVPDATIVWR
jgi:hypothetical protein